LRGSPGGPGKVYPEAREDFVIACEPWGADELKWLGVDFVALANNHATDYGVKGMFSTIANLKRVGIGYAGAGKDLEEAARPRYIDTAVGRVAQVSFTAWQPKGSNASLPHPYLAADRVSTPSDLKKPTTWTKNPSLPYKKSTAISTNFSQSNLLKNPRKNCNSGI